MTQTLDAKAAEFAGVIKIGRTHTQVGLGRIVALRRRSSASYRIHKTCPVPLSLKLQKHQKQKHCRRNIVAKQKHASSELFRICL
jgi:hypothetical protein